MDTPPESSAPILSAKVEEKKPDRSVTEAAIRAMLLASAAVSPVSTSLFGELISLVSKSKRAEVAERKRTVEEEKAALVKDLLKSGIDPALFDSLLSNEINRRLKVHFGVYFLLLTCLFTAASYAIVVYNAVYQWKISEVAITALIIQAPIQLIGILYIIARNLFPNADKKA